MFDPMRLLSEAQEGMLQYEQRQFFAKYFYDPQFLPVVLEQLEDEHSISDSMKRAVGRPLDPEILDMMKPPNNTRAKELDKGFLSASHRLGIALGPLLQLWSLGREARDTNGTVPTDAVNTLVEKTFVSLGQVNAAILFSRRKNLLARFLWLLLWFVKDSWPATLELVVLNGQPWLALAKWLLGLTIGF